MTALRRDVAIRTAKGLYGEAPDLRQFLAKLAYGRASRALLAAARASNPNERQRLAQDAQRWRLRGDWLSGLPSDDMEVVS